MTAKILKNAKTNKPAPKKVTKPVAKAKPVVKTKVVTAKKPAPKVVKEVATPKKIETKKPEKKLIVKKEEKVSVVSKHKEKSKREKSNDSSVVSEILLTKEWYDKVKEELEYLRTTKRREVADRLREAISYWDLSENSEYEEAKNEQAFVEWRIIELEKKLKNAKIISDVHANTINIWSTVEVEEVSWSWKSTFTIVWSTEAEPFQWRISNESPLWRALLWLKKWDIAKVNAPKWLIEYKIIKIL